MRQWHTLAHPSTYSTQRLFAVLWLPLLVPLLACGPLAMTSGQAPGAPLPPSAPSIPIAFNDLPPTAPCRIAAAFAATVDGLIYSQGGARPDRDPIDPATGTYYSRTGPHSYDCSGLTQVAYSEANVAIGGITDDQLHAGSAVPCTTADLAGAATRCWATGDLVLFLNAAGVAYHVEMYLYDGVFAGCLNWTDGCRVWQRAPNSFPAQYVVRRVVNDCVRSAQNVIVGSWRGQGIQAAMTAMGLDGATITGRFDDGRGALGRHGGTDFATSEGTPVYALFGGTVEVSAYIDYPNGNYVIIRSPSGQRAYYGHFHTRAVEAGATVEAGTLIGTVGKTGYATGPHVHFQITDDVGGDWIDPELYFGPGATRVWIGSDWGVLWQRPRVFARAA